jgi:hypothetical protein
LALEGRVADHVLGEARIENFPGIVRIAGRLCPERLGLGIGNLWKGERGA